MKIFKPQLKNQKGLWIDDTVENGKRKALFSYNGFDGFKVSRENWKSLENCYPSVRNRYSRTPI